MGPLLLLCISCGASAVCLRAVQHCKQSGDAQPSGTDDLASPSTPLRSETREAHALRPDLPNSPANSRDLLPRSFGANGKRTIESRGSNGLVGAMSSAPP